jgi:hypothetical protein
LIHRLKHTGNDGFIFKVDFEKDFDLVFMGVFGGSHVVYGFWDKMEKFDLGILITIKTCDSNKWFSQ